MPVEQKALLETRTDDHSLSVLDLRSKGTMPFFCHVIDVQ